MLRFAYWVNVCLFIINASFATATWVLGEVTAPAVFLFAAVCNLVGIFMAAE